MIGVTRRRDPPGAPAVNAIVPPMSPETAELVSPARFVRGLVRPPGDKSISHRYALLASLADGRSRFTWFAPGADATATLACLRALGVDVRERDGGPHEGRSVDIVGRGLGGLDRPSIALDAANSGTTMRLLTGVVAAHPFTTTITGDASLCRRPMRRVIEPLARMGARIDSIEGRPPLTIAGLVGELGVEGKRIAIERNGEIVPRSRYSEVQLVDGDRLEVVVAVGGG